ncbi:hypothetical protein FB451DRAFT_1176899 [Mycena latifolia]|nr:hypothetical protein FB451DRAFT_1182417 [Mycena latifolia]KAJ7469665.1 hypothetical protein FB451DRAFT_1176899 [Mycena latifolia]
MSDMPGGSSAFGDINNEREVSMYDHDGDDASMNGDGHDVHTHHVWASQQRPERFDSAQIITMDGGGHGLHMNAVWAAQERPQQSNPAKRVAVSSASRNDILDARDVANGAQRKAIAIAREKREAESKLLQAEQHIADLQNEHQRLLQRDQEWQTQQAQWAGVFEEHREKLYLQFKQEIEAQRNQNFGQFSMQLEAETAAREAAHKQQLAEFVATREAEHHRQLAELQEKTRLEQEKTQLELEKKQADYDTKLAAFHSRFTSQKRQPPQNNGMEDVRSGFPNAPPARTPQFVPALTRQQRAVESIIRQGTGSLPNLSMTAPTPTEPSAEPETPATPEQGASRALGLVDLGDPRVLEQLKGLLGLGEASAKKSPSKKRSRKAKTGATAALVEARRGQQQALGAQDDLRWKTVVRENWRLNTGLNRAKDFYDYEGVSTATMQRCEDGEIQPDANSYQLFFGTGWATCMWNKCILEKARKELLQKRDEDPGHYDIPDVSDGYILALFVNCLKDARSEWNRFQPRPGESHEAARERAETYREARRDTKVGFARKVAKFGARQKTTERMVSICLAKGDRAGADAWKWLGDELLDQLDAGGMSSEDDEVVDVQCGDSLMATTAHSIKICPWRLPKITGYLDMIDKTPMKTKPGIKRLRIRSNKQSTTDAPLGLPRALYDPAWLSEQKKYIPDIEEHLEISEKEWKLMEINVSNQSSA